MKTKEKDSVISVEESYIFGYKAKLAVLREKIKEETVNYLNYTYYHLVDTNVRNKPEITKAIGIESLKEMKKELDLLLEGNKNKTINYFNDNLICDFESYELMVDWNLVSKHINLSSVIKGSINRALHVLLGDIGSLLSEYGYISVDQAEWRDMKDKVVCDYDFPSSDSKILDDTITEYITEFLNMFNTIEHLRDLKKQCEKQEAEELLKQA